MTVINQEITPTKNSLNPKKEVEIKSRPSLSKKSRRDRWFFLLPACLFQLVWGWCPLVVAFVLSFTDAKLMQSPSFVGLSNYTQMWNDPLMRDSFRVTLIYAALTILLTFVIPIIVAILLMEMPPRLLRIMMLLWFLPISTIASTILWKYMYNIEYGLLQYLFTGLGMPQRFLNDSSLVLFWLIFPGILLFGPGLLYMAALQSVPTSYYEAAEVEGAGFWRKMWTISLPRLRPIISMLLTFAIIASLQEFRWPKIMTDGNPGNASRTVVMYVYNMWGDIRYADATVVSVYLFALILLITVLFRTFFKEDPDV